MQENTRFLEFTVLENSVKRQKNTGERRNIHYFPSFDGLVNTGKQAFSSILLNSLSQKM